MSTTLSRRRVQAEHLFRRSDFTTLMSATILIAALAGCSSPAAPAHQEIDAGASDPVPTADPAPTGEGNAIADLRVESVDGSTVTLAFTQVADASGSPANYEIRYQKDRLTDWDSAQPVVDGTCEGSLIGTKVGDPYVCTVENLSLGVTYELQAVAFRSNQSSMVDGESQRVMAATPPPPDQDGEVITEHSFTSPIEDGWVFRNGSTDPGTEPNFEHGVLNGDGFGQANYTTSLAPGTGPIFVRRTWAQTDEVTVKMKWQLSPNFNASTGSNNKKIFLLEASNTHPVVLGVNSTSSLYLATQRTAEPGDGAKQITGGSIVPGQIYDVTLYVKVNSVDSSGNSIADGVGTVWIDGARVIHGTDFRFRGSDSPVGSGEIWEPQDGIDGIRWNPTWPGGGDSPSELMWERLYDVAVSSGSGG